jgi:uncharacterized protein YjbI with pentapeptide repeats
VQRLNNEAIYNRLTKGKPLDALGLKEVAGRVYIDGLTVPEPKPTGEGFTVAGLTFGVLGNIQSLRKVTWENLHFVDCNLCHLGFFRCAIRNCRFDRCDCRHLGFWESQISDTAFEKCDMREVAFGGNDVFRPKHRNEFRSVIFERCDLRESAHSCELYKDCTFRHCHYGRLDFSGAVFEDCLFEGNLGEAMFANRDPEFLKMPENKLLRTDFRNADVSQAAFDNIDIDPSWFPVDDDLIILHHGAEDWRRWLREGYIEPTEGSVWFIEEMARRSGTPSIFSKSLLTNRATFTEDQVEALIAISEGRTPKAPDKR